MHDEPDFYIHNDDEPDQPPEPVVVHEHVRTSTNNAQVVKNRREYMKFIGIILFLLVAALLMGTLITFSVEEVLRWFMGGFFIIFGSFKLINYEETVLSLREYDGIAKKYKLYAYLFPFIEVLLGIFFALNMVAIFRDVVTIIIMAVGAWGVYKSILRKQLVESTYLGNILRLPLTTVNLTEYLLMGALAVVMLLTNLFVK